MRKLFLPLVAGLALSAPAPAPYAAAQSVAVAQAQHPAWARDAVIYEVNVRQYTPAGTFAAFQQQLPRLRKLGVDMLWLMPVQPIGKANRKGSLGSYYSVADYRGVNAEYGNAADFKALTAAAHRLGMKVILDWVPNHSAFDNPWITQHPDWYVHRPDGSISNARDNEGRATDWTDVAELNYDNAAMRLQMIADMRYWLDSMGVDGFRCDVAGGVPYDFWRQARTALRAGHRGLFMLAEAEDPKMHEFFDMTYGWELHHLLNQVAQGKAGTGVLDAYLAKQRQSYPADAYRMYFTSNHDENSWNGSEFERMGANHKPAFVLAATLQNSMPLLYTGQEASMQKRLRFFDKDTVDWGGASLADFYRTLFQLKHRQAALANGAAGGTQVTLKTDGGDKVYAFTRTRGASTVLVAVNFSDVASTVTYQGLQRPGGYTDGFTKATIELPPAGKLAIPAHGYRVLVR